jgi:hypothetical protein
VEIWVSQFLPKGLVIVLPAVTLIIVGIIVEKYYVGRISLLTNAVALSTFFAFIENLNWGIILYINILTIFGIVALISYAFRIKLPKEFYFIAGVFSSIISGVLLIYGLTL